VPAAAWGRCLSSADEFFVGRNETMIELTERQREVLIKLGGSSSFEMVASDVWNELIALRLIHRRSDGKYDLTQIGEEVYDKLMGKN